MIKNNTTSNLLKYPAILPVDDTTANSSYRKNKTWIENKTITNNLNYYDPIIGIYKFASGNTSGAWYYVNKNGNIVERDSSYFNSHPIYSNIKEEIVDGQYMIKIPKFYVKNDNHNVIYISPTNEPGFHCHPAFMKNGVEQDCFWIGKYEGYVDGNNKMCSLPGVTPKVNIYFDSYRQYAKNRNINSIAGFDLVNIYQISAIQMLILVELKSTDVKTLIGVGNAGTSTLKPTNDPAVITANYRGIIGLWGNTWEAILGIQTDANNKLQIWDKSGNQTWINTNISTIINSTYAVSGHVDSMLINNSDTFSFLDMFIPKSVVAAQTNGTYASATYGSMTSCAFLFGGSCNQTTDLVGLFCCNMLNPITGINLTTVAGRLTKI